MTQPFEYTDEELQYLTYRASRCAFLASRPGPDWRETRRWADMHESGNKCLIHELADSQQMDADVGEWF